MGKYSSDSDSVDSYKKKKKSRHRSSSKSSSDSRYSSSKSKRNKKCRKHKKKSGRSRSRDKDKRSRSSRKHSRDRDRDVDRYSKRSRSRSYSVGRSPTRHRHRSKDSDTGSTRRSRSRDRRRHKSRSSSRRRSRSKERRARDDGAELLEKLNKAAIQAMADNSKLREATLNLVNQVAERESAILEIKSSSFIPKSFSSSAGDRRSEDLPAIIELPEPKPVKINLSAADTPQSLLHPNLLLEDSDEKLNRWVRKLFLIRQRAIKGEPLMYG